jgi:hypothetical protein
VSQKHFSPVVTSVGILQGRDAIFLDSFQFELHGVLTLKGSLNGRLLERPVNEELAYTLVFTGVLALKVTELDSWDYSSASSFDEVNPSRWRVELRTRKMTPEHRHYLVQTYDDVIEVICTRYQLTLS